MPCSPVEVHRRFGGIASIFSTDSIIHSHRYDKLEFKETEYVLCMQQVNS
jgi:hypothetical protein